MSILTNRELEFLASLKTDWPRLYWNEFMRLQQEDAERRDAAHRFHCVIRPFERPKDLAPNLRVVN